MMNMRIRNTMCQIKSKNENYNNNVVILMIFNYFTVA